MKLVSMLNRISEIRDSNVIARPKEILDGIYYYANFLKILLQLGFFVPCDEDGNVLEEPKPLGYHEKEGEHEWDFEKVRKYNEAKERVIFEGFEVINVCDDKIFIEHENVIICFLENGKIVNAYDDVFIKNIESLVTMNLTLTQNAINQFKLR